MVCFGCGGARFAIPAHAVAGVTESGEAAHVAAALGGAPAAERRTVALQHGERAGAMTVDAPVVVRDVPSERLLGLPRAALSGDRTPARNAFVDDGDVVLVLDVVRLLDLLEGR